MEGAHVIEINELTISNTVKPKHGYLGGIIKETKAEVCLFQKTRRRTCERGDEGVYEPSVNLYRTISP